MNIKTIVPLILAAGISASASNYTCSGSTSVPKPVSIVDVKWNKISSSRYADLYARCGDDLAALNSAQSRANRIVRNVGFNAAANELIATLQQQAANVPAIGADVALPHTMMAIKASAQIVNALSASLNGRDVPVMMAGQVKFVLANKLYNLIKQAYNEIDSELSRPVVYNCYGRGCYDGSISIGYDAYPQYYQAYYNGVRDLAVKFIDLQKQTDGMQATDNTELAMTAAVAGAAKEILLNSMFRRSYACGILELQSIQSDAQEFMCSNPGYNQADFVRELRQRLENVNFPKQGCGWGHGHHHRHY